MESFRRFLSAPNERVVVLYLGGLVAHGRARSYRLATAPDLAFGAYVARVTGRRATLEHVSDEPFDLSDYPRETGHYAEGFLMGGGGRGARMELLGQPEPDVLAPVRARRHPAAALLFDEALFEGEVEVEAREALACGRGLRGIGGVGPSLRGAFALATAARVGRARDVAVSPHEIRASLAHIAEEGAERAVEAIEALARERASRLAEAQRRTSARDALRTARAQAEQRAALSPTERAEQALAAAGGRLLRARRVSDDTMEVWFEYMGERFGSMVHPESLHVLDAGICLDGADDTFVRQ